MLLPISLLEAVSFSPQQFNFFPDEIGEGGIYSYCMTLPFTRSCLRPGSGI